MFEKFFGCNGDESLQIDGYSLTKRQEGNNTTEKLDAKEHREFRSGAGICEYMTEQSFDIAFSTKEIMREAAGPTSASKTKLKRIARYLKGRQRCVLNLAWVGNLDDVIHVTVDADWTGNPKTRCTGNWPVLHSTSLVSDTSNSVTILS